VVPVIEGPGVTQDGGAALLLGLTFADVAAMAAGASCHIPAAKMVLFGLPAIDIALVFGETEQVLLAKLAAAGVEIQHDPSTSRILGDGT
jgi:hypothetical protein